MKLWIGQVLGMLVLAAVALAMAGCGGDSSAAPQVPTSMPAVKPAPKPTGPLAKGASCVTPECHAKLTSAKQVHQPVAVKACDTCHEADIGGHRYPLKRKGNDTCTFCHAVSGTKAHQHKALEQGHGCLNCHNPHASPTKFLLVADSVGALCAKCHDVPLKPHAHEPFAAGQCTVCHQPHQADTAKLLRNGSGNDHCFSCHTETQKLMASASHVHAPAKEACTTCHGPHATDNPKQLLKPVNQTCLGCHKKIGETIAGATYGHAALVTGSGCANCHSGHASNQRGLLKARADKVCLSCHDKELPTPDGRMVPDMKPALTATNLHGPVKSANCTECHEVHGAKQPNLLREPFPKTFYTTSFDIKNYALCFRCHEQQMVLKDRTTTLTNFRDGDRNLHYLHVHRDEKGRTCKTCHDVHGSNLPRHMATAVPFEGSSWAMPIKYEQKPGGGRCTPACHEAKVYNREAQATEGEATTETRNTESKTTAETAPAARGEP